MFLEVNDSYDAGEPAAYIANTRQLLFWYLRQGGCYAIALVCLSVSLPVCVQDYCKSDEPISLKLPVMIAPTNRKN